MKTNNIYIDFHVLQTFPTGCLNRDDTGRPKTAVYGGVTRARVSSQAWKHEMRRKFKEIFTENSLGVRTKYISELVEKNIRELDPNVDENECIKMAEKVCKNAGLKGKKESALVFLSNAQAKAIAQLAIDKNDDKEAYKTALNDNPSIDLALFGRMIATKKESDCPISKCDAAAQVAHSISTHAVHNEYDYFTAVDDLRQGDNDGAGHLDTIEFNSATLYRYANVNIRELFKSLGNETAAAVKGFAKAFITSMPTGRQNSFANRTLPDMIYVTLRTDQPVNLAGAFEKPIRANGGYVEESQKALVNYAKKVYTNFAAEPDKAWNVGDELGLNSANLTLPQLLDELEQAVNSML